MISGDNKFRLRLGGFLITFIIIFLSGSIGWCVEQLSLKSFILYKYLGNFLLVLGLTSAMATKSLVTSIVSVLKSIPPETSNESLKEARRKLSYIVGRDVAGLSREEIMRALSETTSENSVDGVFAPLFWMFIGANLWHFSNLLPGPLAMVFIYKASSTMDSMLGYKIGRLQWLGTGSARLDDLLTWIPSRIVLISLPLISQPIHKVKSIIEASIIDGRKYSSPNAGLSEAIFAHCTNTTMGGENKYNGQITKKPIIANTGKIANENNIKLMINLIYRLELTWILFIATYYLILYSI